MIAWFVGAVFLVLGGTVLLRSWWANAAVRRGRSAPGVVRRASRTYIADDGRQWWNVSVDYRIDTGEQVTVTTSWSGTNVDREVGRTVEVWYESHRPERAHVVRPGETPGAGPMLYVGGGLCLAIGVVVLVVAALT